MKFCFPFRTAAGAEYSSAAALFDLQQSEGSGHYLLGKNNFWHGGIHFTDKSIPHCKDREMIRCMADGEIVAYRLNSGYLQSLWQAQALQYSTSFCLVRHRYESPAAAASNNNAPARNALTFFTLYMHLAPFATYAGNREPYRIKISAKDLRARDQASLASTVLGTLNKNAELEVISLCEVKSGNSIYAFADAILRKGSAKDAGGVALAPGSRFWLAISKVTNSAQGSSKEMFAEFVRSEDARRPHWWPANNRVLVHSRVNARDKIGRDGARLGLIAVGSELEYDAASVQTLTLDGRSRRFAECRLLSGGYSDRTAPPPARFWVCIDADFVAVQAGDPVGLDKVVTCNIPVKAGDPLGYMGLYETAKAGGGKKSKHQVHIELFTGDPNLQAFLENRAGVSQGEKFLKLGAGTALFACDTRTPPGFAETDIKLDSPFMAPFGTGKTLKDANDVEWLQVDLTDDGHCMSGFVRVDAGEIITRHDWLKMGFQTVRAKSASESYLSKTVTSAFYQDLYKAVTGEPAPADRDNVRIALTGDENQEKWSKLIVKHPSEWKARSIDAQWSVLDLILRNTPDRRDHEKDRIDKSVWWDEVTGTVTELPKDGVVWHFHPIGMLTQLEKLSDSSFSRKVRAGQITYDAEGVENPNSKHFSRVIHWPETELSGVTLGRGYDMGSRTRQEVYDDLTAVGLPEYQVKKISLSAGMKGNRAKDFVDQYKVEIGEITLEQQVALFDLVYPAYVDRAKENYNKWTADQEGKVDWDNLKIPIREILVDFVYQGFTKGPRPMLAGMKNDPKILVGYIKNTPQISQYEPGRRRAAYLEKSMED